MRVSGAPALGLLSIMIVVVSSGMVYVKTGGNITDCMKCLHPNNSLHLHLDCRERWGTLLLFDCRSRSITLKRPRILLDTDSGCWTLTDAGKEDSCLYKVWYRDSPESPEPTTDVRVLDPVLISNITSNFSWLGEEMAVSVQFSGEESAVTWEVDGEPIPERYRLIDDNRTLIIPSVQRDDAERRFRVRITNPVSEEIREYRLIDDPVFSKVLITEDYEADGRNRVVTAAMCVVAVLIIIIIIMGIIYMKHQNCSRNRIPEIQKDTLYTPVPQHNGSVPAVTEHNEP